MSHFNPYAPPTEQSDYVPYAAYQYQPTFMLAGRGTRFGAHILDNLLLVGAMLIPMFMFMATESPAAFVLAVFPLALIGYQWYLIATTGQSLAKKWLNIRIVKSDGSPVDFVSGVILRNWVIAACGMIPYVGSFVSLADALWIFGEECRCLHDKIADTIVVQT